MTRLFNIAVWTLGAIAAVVSVAGYIVHIVNGGGW
jgi:hypothetical protein